MSNTKSVDPSLWWDPFSSLLTELENASLSSDLPPHLVKKLNANSAWFVDTVGLFKQPNEKSKEALNSERVKIGSHELSIQPNVKDKALQFSTYLNLDEVQSYILVERSLERSSPAVDSVVEENLHMILLQYYIERQCLLKCTRRILTHALYVEGILEESNIAKEEAVKLISAGLERKLVSVLQDLLSSTNPEQMDVDLFTLWAEETLIEDNLVLDILFLIYYESFCTCKGEHWRKLCSLYKGILSGSYNVGKLAVSTEAHHASYRAKIQLLLILIETLNLESVLQMVHDGKPLRHGTSTFSLADIQEMDTLISSFDIFEMKEAGPLVLTWAVFLCLISSLPGKEEINVLMEIDHVAYVRQAFEATSLSCFLEILQSDILKEPDGPVAGYRSVLRTFVSAFIASYEINLQLEDTTLNLILDILCTIYRGEESLCTQFWDRESFIDGPIRCLLCNLEGEFPFRIAELIRLLSSLCEGSWPSECVYNFLDKSVGISTLFEITSDSFVDSVSQIVETNCPLPVSGLEGLLIPSKTRGHVLKVFGEDTALVRWEFSQSAVLVLLLRLANMLYSHRNEEIIIILDLINRVMSFNMALCFALLDIGNTFYAHEIGMSRHTENNIWVVEVICTVVRNASPNSDGAAVMSLGVDILAKMLRCSPSHVAAVALKANIFDMAPKSSAFDIAYNVSSSESWLLSGKLTKMILIDNEQNENDQPLAISVLEFALQLVETGLENVVVLNLVAFCLQYILVSHEYWKYKVKHVRWRVTLKVLELMRACLTSTSFCEKHGEVIPDMLLSDSSVHNSLFRIICTTTQNLEKLYVNRFFELAEIEGWELAIVSVLDIIILMLSKVPKDVSSSNTVFHQAIMSSGTKPIPVVIAVVSLISHFTNPAIQVGAAKVFSMLLTITELSQQHLLGNICFGLEDIQIADLSNSIRRMLFERAVWNEDLFVAIMNMLTSAACYQPAFLVAVFGVVADSDVKLKNAGEVKHPTAESPIKSQETKKTSLVDGLLLFVEKSVDLINSKPRVMLSVLSLLKALWQGAGQYLNILESLKSTEKFWKQLCNSVSGTANRKMLSVRNMSEAESVCLASKYQCESAILEIMAHDMFLKNKLLYAESLVKKATEPREKIVSAPKTANDCGLKDIFSSWCSDSVLDGLIRSYTSCEYDIGVLVVVKVAVSLMTVHLIGKLATSTTISSSVSLLENILSMSKKLTSQPAFIELLAQYSKQGYSDGKELNNLILSDLYYHLQGELEGRNISLGPFKELSQYITNSNILQKYEHEYDDNHGNDKDGYLFDTRQLRADLGLDRWDYSEWKASTKTAEMMLDSMQKANSMVLISNSKLSALQALITVLTVYEDESMRENTTNGRKIPDQLCLSCIDYVCQQFHVTVESLGSLLDPSEYIIDFLAAQAELLFLLLRSVKKNLSLSVCILLLKTSGFGIKVLNDLSSSVAGVKKTMKLLLMLLFTTVGLGSVQSCIGGIESRDVAPVEDFTEISNVSLGLLPMLCNLITTAEHFTIPLTITDLILRSFMTPNTWFPIIQKHLQLQRSILKLQDRSSDGSIPIILKFFLTIARVRGGAEMLLNAGFLSSLKVLFVDLSDTVPSLLNNEKSSLLDISGKPQPIWGLGLAVITAIIHSLGQSSSCIDVVENVIPYIFSEKAHLVSHYLTAPDFPLDDNNNNKKRPRTQRTHASLTSLKETEHTLMLMCTLAKHWKSWVKAMKEMDSPLRETSIHLLAFISRGAQRLKESSHRNAPILCPPILKDEFDCSEKASFVNSRNGWFALTPLGCVTKPNVSTLSSSSALVLKNTETPYTASQNFFSDSVALQIYKITFLLLKFLCLQAESAAKRAEEVGFVDLAHFPELPMPEILHGIQDQAISIVAELCENNKLKQISPEVQRICLLLLQIMEMGLQLELCVLHICGIRPVLGRVENFSKEVKLLVKATEGHVFLKSSMKSLKQIISLVFPGML